MPHIAAQTAGVALRSSIIAALYILSITLLPFYALSVMDRNIKVIGEKEERVRAKLKAVEKETAERAFRYYDITRPLYRALFFAHMDNDEKLGYFAPSDEIIVLSESLLDYPFSEVRNILIHECAHAVDYYVHASMTGHSVFFRDACTKLGIDKGFEKARIKGEVKVKAKAREKLDKLLALSSSSFENEALVALEKARELIKKASLEEDTDEEKIYFVEVCEKGRIATYVVYISIIVSENTGVFFVKNHKGGSVSLTAYGSLEQCESALYLFDYLISALDDEVARLRKSGRRISKDSFMIGAYDAIKKKTAGGNDTAVVRSIKLETEEKAKRIAFKDTYLRTGHTKVSVDKNSFDSGSSFGRNLDLSGEMQKRIGD